MLLEYVAENSIALLLGASFTGGVAIFYLVMQRTLRKRTADRAA